MSYAENNYETVQNYVQIITKKLETNLYQLRGVEALYQVKVDIEQSKKSTLSNRDTRKSRSIRLLNLNTVHPVDCIYLDKEKPSNNNP